MTATEPSPSRFVSGFTLVEVLVGLTLLGLVLIMVFSGLHTTTRSWQAGDRQANINDDKRLALSFIRRQLNQTVPIYYLTRNENQVIFQGDSESLYFVARLPAHRGGTDLYLASFSLAEDESSLDFSYRPLHPDMELFSPDDEQIKHRQMIANIRGVEFSYYGRETPEDEPRWHDRWEEMDRLPVLVRLRLESDSANEEWPELHIRIPSQVERGQPQTILVESKT